ncbi:MAG: cytochrome C biosynthesis protein [Deltaproteobacteria bacterium HGW-Deltaproteobacteria-8]|jgi:cytochrome c-type biogenesis protein|nr:MAG: cytochrome C biosynthesis protein [Deltaproteobacteria bacterium HGW-Deltaproteobacteria-8]
MFDQFLLTINGWMSAEAGMSSGVFALALTGSFLWGLVSVLFSPCHLASIPLMVGYVAGQGRLVQGREAVRYAVAFSLGLFVTIALVGLACSLLGRLLGDVGPYWTVAVGAVLLWVGLDMLGLVKCNITGGLLSRFTLRGLSGALVLGLGYGLLSGTCTFGFLAPLLAVASVQGQVLTGALLILAFALGHCLPIVVAGSSAALAQRTLERFSGGSTWVRRVAGVLVSLLGAYFIARPFLEA